LAESTRANINSTIGVYLNEKILVTPMVSGEIDTPKMCIMMDLSKTEAKAIVDELYGIQKEKANKSSENYAVLSNEVIKKANEKQNDNETIKNTLRIATNAEFEPFEFMENGEITGFDIDLMKDLCNRMDYEAEFINVDFDDVMPFVYNDKADCGIAAITINDERKRLVDFTDIYISAYIDYDGDMYLEKLAISVKKDSPLRNKLNAAIQEAIIDGSIDNLARKYDIQYE